MFKRSLYVLSNKFRRRREPAERMKEKWIADFSKPEKSCFLIKPEISCNAYLEKGSLVLGLKKKNCMAWLETANRVYVDQIINAHFHFDGLGGYCASGIMFRIAEQGTYYLALVSSKGYFRLDAVNNNTPRPLIGWTEAPGLGGCEANLGVIAQGDHLIFFLNGRWIAEIHDNSIPGGHLGFALVSYDSESTPERESSVMKEGYVCQAWLNSLSVDSRANMVRAEYKKWHESAEISAESRFRLAKSLATLDHFGAAYNQILKAWQQREESVKTVTATYTEMRTKGELLFAARMASQLELYETAEEHLNDCFAMGVDDEEMLDVFAEKTKILSAQNKYADLVELLPEYIKLMGSASFSKDHVSISSLYALLGYACWNLNYHEAAATAWGNAFKLDSRNGLYAAFTADAFEQIGNHEEALRYRLDAAHCFLQQENHAELKALIPKLQTTIAFLSDYNRLIAFADTVNQIHNQFTSEHFVPIKVAFQAAFDSAAASASAEKSKAAPTKEQKTQAKEKAASPKPEAVKKTPAKATKKPEKKPTAKAKPKPQVKAAAAKKTKPQAKTVATKKTTAKPTVKPKAKTTTAKKTAVKAKPKPRGRPPKTTKK